MSDTPINVEVAYARPDKQRIIALQVAPGTTAEQAVLHSGILGEFPDIALPQCDLGIFSKLTPHGTPLKAGDRVEIYRPLIADPKEVRRQRAAEGRKKKSLTAP